MNDLNVPYIPTAMWLQANFRREENDRVYETDGGQKGHGSGKSYGSQFWEGPHSLRIDILVGCKYWND